MRLPTDLRPFIVAVLGIFLSSGCTEVAQPIPDSVIAFWEDEWRLEVDELAADVSAEFGEKFLSDANPEKKSAFVLDMKRTIRSEISWESHGKQVVEKLLSAICGADLLEKVAPYHGLEHSPRDMPADLLSDYARCSSDVRLSVNGTQVRAITDAARDVYPSLFRTYGIDDDSD